MRGTTCSGGSARFLNSLGGSGLPLSAGGAVNLTIGETRVSGRELNINRGELGRLPGLPKAVVLPISVLLLRRAAAHLQWRPYRTGATPFTRMPLGPAASPVISRNSSSRPLSAHNRIDPAKDRKLVRRLCR